MLPLQQVAQAVWAETFKYLADQKVRASTAFFCNIWSSGPTCSGHPALVACSLPRQGPA